jgi:hypothetical protein
MSSEVPAVKVINYQGNSKIDREVAAEEVDGVKEPSKLQKIEGISVVKAKPSFGKRLKASFGGDDAKTVGMFLLTGVMLPKLRDLAFDLIQEGAHRSLYGDGRRGAASTTSSMVGSGTRIRQTNYGAPSSRSGIVGSVAQAASAAPSFSQRERSNFDFSNLVFPDITQAEEVLERLAAAIDEFNVVPVADFYDAIGVTGTGFTDQKFGWDRRNFEGASVKRVREGWVLDLPIPREI